MIICKDVDRIFKLEYSTYHVLNRSELCECSLRAGNYLLSQTASNCGDMPEAKDGFFATYYAFNKIVLGVLIEKFNIQIDDETITQSALLHSDILGYDLPALDFVSPSEEAQSRLLRGTCRTDLFVEVTNLMKGNTVWTHFTSTGYYITLIRLSRQILKKNCFKMMHIDWDNTVVTGISSIKIEMPTETKVSIFTDNDLTHINDDHFEINLVVCLLNYKCNIHSSGPTT